MALSRVSLTLFVREVLPRVTGRQRVVSLGMPHLGDTQTTGEGIADIFSAAEYQVPADVLLDYDTLFGALGFRECHTLDIRDQGTAHFHRHDLNCPLKHKAPYLGADLVLDPGTIEHVFDIAQVMCNIVALLTKGGIVFHVNPVNWVGHGFHNLSPKFFHQFYAANGFDDIVTWRRAGKNVEIWPYDPRAKYIPTATGEMIYTRARKMTDEQTAVVPIQTAFEAEGT